jgi:hypothetical protein
VRVDDSKRLHRPAAGLGPLEREVLAVLAARDGTVPGNGLGLLAVLGAGGPPTDHPWYAGLRELPLPRAAGRDEALDRGRALARALAGRGVSLAALSVDVLPEGRFNEAVGRTGNKAATLFERTAGALASAGAMRGLDAVDLLCDRQGARARYAGLLRERFPGRPVRVVREGKGASEYELGEVRSSIRLRFEEKADGLSPAVGLASMAAKYVREVHMAALNAWILREAPGVRPTAGYWTDGRRFLMETGPARRRLGVDDGLFVRAR